MEDKEKKALKEEELEKVNGGIDFPDDIDTKPTLYKTPKIKEGPVNQ